MSADGPKELMRSFSLLERLAEEASMRAQDRDGHIYSNAARISAATAIGLLAIFAAIEIPQLK